jgi:hypothetical protein
MRLVTRLVDWALTACESDPVVAVCFFNGKAAHTTTNIQKIIRQVG